MKRAWLVAGIVVLCAACSRGTEAEDAARAALPEDLPACDDLFKNGDPVLKDQFGLACRNSADELEVPRYASVTCVEGGSDLMWNSRAWGYDGQAMTLWSPDEIKMPTAEILECMGGGSAEEEEAGTSSG